MLNDPTVLEASLALADKTLQQKKSADEMISECFKRIICRTPTSKEIALLRSYYDERVTALKSNPGNAEKIIKVGEYKPVTKSPKDLAALMQVIQVIYNMEEAITKT